jgi:phosphonatase-like hydrolase
MVVVDLVGTTLRDDTGAVPRAMRDALDAGGLSVRDGALEGVHGLSHREAITTLLEGHGRDDLAPRAGAIHADLVTRLERHFRTPGSAVPTDGCLDALVALRRTGVRVALGSALPAGVVAIICAQLGWTIAGPFDAIIACDEVSRPRPYPDMIDALRHRLGDIPAASVAKVGCSPLDLQEGTMAGCGLVVAVASNPHARERLMQHPHDAMLGSVGELPALLSDRGLISTSA